jgi:hypothetical protein
MENRDTEGRTHSTSGGAASDVLLVEKSPKKSHSTPDLSAEIAMTVEREKGERVKCRRVFGDNYRCNWMSVDTRGGARGASLAVDTYRVRASKFLRVRKHGEHLVIEDATGPAVHNN